ncbi:MAG: beta-propeller domain-containing protein [Clostridia bacterium]|nr:beta-propeller domain-containing protein [Clostridia bacterium]
MNFNRFKKQYKAMASAETPDVPVAPQVAETAKPRFSQRPAFRFAMAALSLLLVVGISLTAVYMVPKARNVVASGDLPAVTRCTSYDEIDARFSDAKDKLGSRGFFRFYTKTSGRYVQYGADFELGGVDDYELTVADSALQEADAEPIEKPESSNGSGYSKTNTQVDGVDEADVVKTDGRFVYYCNNIYEDGHVLVFDTYDADLKLAADIDVSSLVGSYTNAYIYEMFLEDGRLSVIFNAYVQPEPNIDYAYDGYYLPNDYGVAIFDVSDPYTPELLRVYTQEGSYVSSRRIGDIVYFITQKNGSYFIEKYDGKPENVVPCIYDSCSGNERGPIAPDGIYVTDTESLDFIILGAVNVKDVDDEASAVTILGAGNTVYASENAVYVFGYNFKYYAYDTVDAITADDADEGSEAENENYTNVFKFTIDGTELAFAASGRVDGSMLNQFAADEYEGNLRIATTVESYANEAGTGYVNKSSTSVTILDGELKQLGKLEGLAVGEHIKSVRFNGATGYVVTFRTVDPLFAFDLSDPANPKIIGELKMPGYSEYLHVYDENTLLGIGQDATAESEDADIAYYQGLKIALFDVGNGEEMSEIDTFFLGDRGTTTTAEWDHKALAYYAERDVFGIPVELYLFDGEQENIYDYGEYVGNAFYVFSMGGGEKISLVSKIEQTGYEGKTLNISRGLFIGDNVITISDGAIQINDFATGEQLGRFDFVEK